MTNRSRAVWVVLAAAWVLALAAPAGWAKVTVLQNGVSPTKDYAGCVDTWISGEQWEKGRNNGGAGVLRTGGKRHILMRFDLSPVPKGQKIHKAVLRLADAGFPRRGRDKAFPKTLEAYALTREWKPDANWLEHTRTDYRKKDAGDWADEGGEYDKTTDFGGGAGGRIAADTVVAGAFGHVHELDVTEVVKRWHAGKTANLGLLLKAPEKSRGAAVASSDWPVPAGRAKLLIDHGDKPAGIPPLAAAPEKVELDSVSKTADPGKGGGDYQIVRVGQNANCHFRGRSASAYVKANAAQYPGTWGWMTQCRVGGVARDVNRTLLYFDLSKLPKGASIKSAKLVCTLVRRTSRYIGYYRNGVFLVKLSEAPGWSSSAATSAERLAGKAWPAGGAAAAASDKPLSLGKVTQKEITVRKQKRRVDWGIEFDVTGAVRAWLSGAAPNCGLLLDNRIEGGAYDIYGAQSWYGDRRPYLELNMSPGPNMVPSPLKIDTAAPTDDYWVQPMRKVHATFKGKAGTFAQYGDSITITGAFLANFGWAGKIAVRNATPDAQADVALVSKYCDIQLWRRWKGGGWGNTGMMKSDWLFRNIDGWQKKMNPEVSVVMFGTNDLGGLVPPQYTEYMAASLRRMLVDGTVPMLTSIPPSTRGGYEDYRLAALSMASGLKVPLIDFQGEILRRRPDDWNGQLPQFKKYKGYQQPTLMHDAHPTNAKEWVDDWSEKGLGNNGYNLRNYMTIRMYAQVIRKVFQAKDK